jgi:hypothetical protein
MEKEREALRAIHGDSEDGEEDGEAEEFYCAACDKQCKSEKQLQIFLYSHSLDSNTIKNLNHINKKFNNYSGSFNLKEKI